MSTQADCRNCRVACSHAGKRNLFMKNGNTCSSFRGELDKGAKSDSLFTIGLLRHLFSTYNFKQSDPPLPFPFYDSATGEIKWTR
jgi:hypothetical protein